VPMNCVKDGSQMRQEKPPSLGCENICGTGPRLPHGREAVMPED
jgi:hypothetical protein